MTYPPPQDPWQQHQPPPPPPPHQPPAAHGAPPYPTAQFPAPAGNWGQAPPRKPHSKTKLALISAAALLLLCCGGVTIAAIVSPQSSPDSSNAGATTSPTGVNGPAPALVDGTTSPPSEAPPASAAATPSADDAAPAVETRTVTQTQKIGYKTRSINDPSLPKGTKKVTTRGVSGVRTLTYEVTYTDGVQTAKKLIRSVVTKAPVTQVVRVGTKQTRSCDPNYSGVCVPIASDVDCAGGSGDGPAYVDGPLQVIGSDIYDLDRDGDGIACDK
ncbi:G5 domain-containing protein [Micromonospora musae]|uniref:G5 domain-containing protein n=1 Tax=Micromonospora musae TaxID=1894970 RepID=UPI003422E652